MIRSLPDLKLAHDSLRLLAFAAEVESDASSALDFEHASVTGSGAHEVRGVVAELRYLRSKKNLLGCLLLLRDFVHKTSWRSLN